MCSPNSVTGIQQHKSTHKLLGKMVRKEEMTQTNRKEGGGEQHDLNHLRRRCSVAKYGSFCLP